MDTYHIPGKHLTTPQKSRVQSLYHFANRNSIYSPSGSRVTKTRLFQQIGISRATAYRALRSSDPRQLHNSEIRKETRGRKPKLTLQDIRVAERLIWKYGISGRILSWDTLAFEAGLAVSAHTLQRQFKNLGYRRCLACRKSFISEKIAQLRIRFAKEMLAKYPTSKDWRNVRFSDEVHLGYGPQGRIYITRKPEEVNCPDCVQHEIESKKEDEKKVHAWGVVGYGYKSRLYRYDAGNSNGAITQTIYLDLLKQELITWPSEMVLEQDGASGHGKGKKGPIIPWLRENQRPFYYNCPYSPDLAPIENAWSAPKAWLRKFGHWDEDSVWEVAQEGWEKLTQQKIDFWCDSMPQRLSDVIASKGQLTAW